MSSVIMICGRLCCGKSTYARRLREENGAAVLSVDEIMLAVFGRDAGERHDEYAARIKEYLFAKSAELVGAGINVILDWGFWTKSERAFAREFCASRGIACELHYLDVSDELWKRRISERNALVGRGEVSAYYVDEGLAEKAASLFELPDDGEIDVRVRDGV